MGRADELLGKCIVCGVFGQGKKDFICEHCGGPDKIMLVCKCGRRNDITALHGRMNEWLPSVICWHGDEQDEKDIVPGTVISVQSCFLCKGEGALQIENGLSLGIYRVKKELV